MNSTALCKNFRTKRMLVPALEPEVAARPGEEPPQVSHCWCNLTLTEVGPDDGPVGPPVCNGSRSCCEE